ncbi:hypothetical protein CDL15_Pgr003833 [Punica granatum]|uniref:Retrotransposon Copia-like N-terminal domain-containing protein n=1 Tax=Punica granatum TaxID=22663 RepID=A0A218XV63_PUNGR|nr:hypothetical protein CDL15_Pgr003833 [Punica granatum]PKI49518.1 hypothetical protein CRG98_030135 [Punica granatum]
MVDSSSSSTLTFLYSSSSNSTALPSSFPTIPVKFNGRNYLYWKEVMTPLLTTYGWIDYVEGRITASSKAVIGAYGNTMLNPDYPYRQSRDNFALTCVMLAVTKKIRVTILSAKMSHEA